MTLRPFTLVGLGADGLPGLAASTQDLIMTADVLVGSKRLLEMIPETGAERMAWPRPFDPMIPRLREISDKRCVILATGDPLNYGIGRKLLQHFDVSKLHIIPHVSAFSLAAARMGWSLPDVDTLTIHGRAVSLIEPVIQPGNRFIALTAGEATIREAADRLCRRGFGKSRMTALANLGSTSEACTDFTAEHLPQAPFDELTTLAVHCIAGREAKILPRTPGLPNDTFEHDGQLTKQEVRASTIAALCPAPDHLLWDVGAGCGSVAIEWMRAARNASAIAFEVDAARIEKIRINMDQLGTPGLQIVAGKVPETLHQQPRPDSVFLGGGISSNGVFETAWDALKPGGRMVANTVTLESETKLIALQQTHGGELVRISIDTLATVGTMHALRPTMPVLQWRVTKP